MPSDTPPRFQTVNPRTGERVGEPHPAHDVRHADRLLDDGVAAQRGWAAVDREQRIEFCRKAAARFRARSEQLAGLITLEMGKHAAEARAEIEKCAALCDYYAGLLTRVGPRVIERAGGYVRVEYRPLGVILGIMPWNFPCWQVARFAVPTVAAGNAVVVKHAPNVPACGEALGALFAEVLPRGIYQNLRLTTERTEALIGDDRIAGVSLTGGTAAGRSVGVAAGRAIKPSVLELGGSDAYLVLADADLELAADVLARGRLVNAGQSCISPKRIIVQREVYAAFGEALVERCRGIEFVSQDAAGDMEGQLAPLARADLRANLHAQIGESVAAGAKLRCGGAIPDGAGYRYPATVLSDVPAESPAFRQELFGPAFALARAEDESQAVRLANDSVFGLGGGVFSRDLDRAERIASRGLRAGAVAVNDFVRSDPAVPFGGVGESGYGRELGEEGLRGFVNVKSISVAAPR